MLDVSRLRILTNISILDLLLFVELSYFLDNISVLVSNM